MHQNGSGRSKISRKEKARAKERVKEKGRQSREIERANLFARIGRPGTVTANGQPTATLPTMDQKGGSVEAISHLTSLPAKATKKAKKQIISMLIEELKDAEEEKETKEKAYSSKIKNASETLLAICRGVKRKIVGFVGLDVKKTDFVPSKREPSFKICLMLLRATENAGNFRPVITKRLLPRIVLPILCPKTIRTRIVQRKMKMTKNGSQEK